MYWTIYNKMALFFSAIVVILIIISLTSFRNAFNLFDANQDVMRSYELQKELENILSLMKDAETGQRGYLITGDQKYLEPYVAAQASIAASMKRLQVLIGPRHLQLDNLNRLKPLIDAKFAELDHTVSLRKTKGFTAARQMVVAGSGKQSMDSIRRITGLMHEREAELLARKVSAANRQNNITMATIITGTLLYLLLLALGFYAVNRYVSDRRKIEAEISQLNDNLERRALQLEQANRALESFCYSVSHDLRGPLRHLNGYSHLLLEQYRDTLDDEGKEYLSRLCSSSKRMGTLIDDLLDLSMTSRIGIKREEIHLTTLARAVAQNLQGQEPARRVRFFIQEDVTAWGDARLLRKALHNLMENSWNYTASRPEAVISFGCKELEDTKTYFVTDNGIGFDNAYADKIFKPFERLQGTGACEGTGIGLAAVRQIVERHDGRAWGEGTIGEGATFYFTLG